MISDLPQEATPMMIGISEGTAWRFEVVAQADGYVVQSRDLDTHALDGPEHSFFRTAVAAFLFAELAAARDRMAAAHLAGDPAGELAGELHDRQIAFETVSGQLRDIGSDPHIMAAWEDDEHRRARRHLH
jgi:hypothetical protein